MFFLAEATTVVFWGMASDRFGRRSILIFGPLGLGITMLGFGASTQFWYLVMFRFLQGAFNGNMGLSLGPISFMVAYTLTQSGVSKAVVAEASAAVS